MQSETETVRNGDVSVADKEYLLGNKARELLKYTNQATKVVTDDISQRDVRKIIQQIAALDDIRDVQTVCERIVGHLDRKEGFTKSFYRCYGEDMRMTAKGIVRDIHAANGKMFATEYAERLKLIGQVLDGCTLMLEYIQICLDNGIISLKKSEVWTKKVTDVKYMTASWKKNDTARANKLKAEAQSAEEVRQIELVKTAIRQVKAGKQRIFGGGVRLILGCDSFLPPTGGSAPRIATPTTVPRTLGT